MTNDAAWDQSLIQFNLPNKTPSISMATPSNQASTPSSLQASYTSPSATQAFTHTLPSAIATSTEEKTHYLSSLRQSVVKLQDEINEFLTGKMEEDKEMAARAGGTTAAIDDKAEEDAYGEERGDEG